MDHERLNDRWNSSIKDMLEGLLLDDDFEGVPRIANLQAGIQMTSKLMKGIYIDKARCKLGIDRLGATRSCSIAWISGSSTSLAREMAALLRRG